MGNNSYKYKLFSGENLPLEVLVITTNADEEAAKHPNMAKNPTGFKIRYTQTPCNSG